MQKTQLSLSKLSFDKKYWLNFWMFPFSSRHPRSKTRLDILYERIFLLPRYPASVCIWLRQIPTPESVFIHLPASCTILAHFLSAVGWQLERGALGYPRGVERGGIGYPSAPPSNFQPTTDKECARVTNFDQFCREVSSGSTGNWIPVSSVCEGSRLAGLGDVRGFVKKFQVLISLMYFFATSFHCFRGKSPRFLQKPSFDKIWL